MTAGSGMYKNANLFEQPTNVPKIFGLAGMLIMITLLVVLTDQHRIVTRRMGWQCSNIEDTANAQYPHVEVAKLWYRDNPHFIEFVSGPAICADLAKAGKPDADVTFDTRGNTFHGLNGYNILKVSVAGRTLVIYGDESGGFYDNDPVTLPFSSEQDKKLHPGKYKFPIDTFGGN